MPYSLPELVLVGAAQNLVLATSPDKDANCVGDGQTDIDPNPDLYNEESTW